ncbi:MAG: NUDIX hydrolase [Bacteroidetes bacterium]|nr:NUDIX hydrolase [Bacteroidota bacterium]
MVSQKIPNLSVDCVIFGYNGKELKVLLIEQKKISEQLKTQYALPGDLVEIDEDLDEAANRVLFELTNIKDIYLEQFQAFGNPVRVKEQKDSDWLRSIREFPEERVITVAYYSLVNIEDVAPKGSAFADHTEWINVKKVPPLAFDHDQILNHALQRFRSELVTKNIGFELLPPKFTLSQLQQLHELVLDKKLDKRNFRKSIKKIDHLEPLDEKQTGVDHKPAQLYRFNPKKED